MPARAAVLAGVGGVHSDEGATGPCCLEAQHRHKRRPRGITNALGETVVVDHSVHRKVLHGDDLKSIDDFARLLMSEVPTLPARPLVNASDHLASLPSLRGALGFAGEVALRLRQRFLFLAEEAGIGDG